MKRLLYFVMLIASIALLLSSCAPAATQASEQPAASSEEPFYVFLPKGLDNPYWDECRKGMESEMAKLGVKAEFLGPAVSDATKQVVFFEHVIARKPAAIAVSPNDPDTLKDSIQGNRSRYPGHHLGCRCSGQRAHALHRHR